MNKIIAIIIIILVIIATCIGVYLYLTMNQKTTPPTTQNTNTAQSVPGMKIEVLKQGEGTIISKVGDNITVNYVGTLTDGKKFDSSIDRNAPFTFKLGQGVVIKGWDLGLTNMKVGEKRKLTISPELAYGPNGFPPIIPKSATLIFEVELLKIN